MSQPELETQYDVYWPRGVRRERGLKLAPRLASLAGKRVGLVWDYLFRGDEVYRVLMAGLQERFPGIEFVTWDVFGNLHGSEERRLIAELPNKLKELKVDAVISAMAA